MQKRASDWMSIIKNTHVSYYARFHGSANMKSRKNHRSFGTDIMNSDVEGANQNGPFAELRKTWPGAAELLDDYDWFRAQLDSDFIRTRENDFSYYASLAV